MAGDNTLPVSQIRDDFLVISGNLFGEDDLAAVTTQKITCVFVADRPYVIDSITYQKAETQNPLVVNMYKHPSGTIATSGTAVTSQISVMTAHVPVSGTIVTTANILDTGDSLSMWTVQTPTSPLFYQVRLRSVLR